MKEGFLPLVAGGVDYCALQIIRISVFLDRD